MNLSEYFASQPGRKRELAAKLGMNPTYLWQLSAAWKGKRVTAELAIRIEEATQGAVTRAELRPDIFGDMVAAPAGPRMPAGNDGQHQEVA